MSSTKIGCELFWRNKDKILLGLRKNCYGAGTWALPGGHLEFNERLVDALCREAKEEMGIKISPSDLKLISIVDDLQPENNLHYVHVSFEMHNSHLQPQLMEPDRCEEWRFFHVDELPQKFFPPHQGIIENYFNNQLYLLKD